jgi:hypothetical protein
LQLNGCRQIRHVEFNSSDDDFLLLVFLKHSKVLVCLNGLQSNGELKFSQVNHVYPSASQTNPRTTRQEVLINVARAASARRRAATS